MTTMAPLYARYVPPKAAPVAAESKPEKKPKKTSTQDSAVKEKNSDGRKKRKRADVDSAPESGRSTDDGVSIPKKHTALLSKFQKAAQRSEAVKATGDHVDVDVDTDAQPELHDLVPLLQRHLGDWRVAHIKPG